MSGKGTGTGHPFAAMLSLIDLETGAAMRAGYDNYVKLVARELSEGMTQDQRYAAGHFLSQVSTELFTHRLHR
jgi:hypothetical protein